MLIDKYQKIIANFDDSITKIKDSAEELADNFKGIKQSLDKFEYQLNHDETDLEKTIEAKANYFFKELEFEDDDAAKIAYELDRISRTFDSLYKSIRYIK
jgi:tRNA U34 5-methylaminomethyl-2-thiouridine-forming methyltransferase MnmC